MVDPALQYVGLGLSGAANILKTLKEMITASDAKAQISELYDLILAAQESALAASAKERSMLETIRSLEEEISRIKAWDKQKERYQLARPFSGVQVYALKKSASDGEVAHYICANCYEDGRRSILHRSTEKNGFTLLKCPKCPFQAPTGYRGGVETTYFEDISEQ